MAQDLTINYKTFADPQNGLLPYLASCVRAIIRHEDDEALQQLVDDIAEVADSLYDLNDQIGEKKRQFDEDKRQELEAARALEEAQARYAAALQKKKENFGEDTSAVEPEPEPESEPEAEPEPEEKEDIASLLPEVEDTSAEDENETVEAASSITQSDLDLLSIELESPEPSSEIPSSAASGKTEDTADSFDPFANMPLSGQETSGSADDDLAALESQMFPSDEDPAWANSPFKDALEPDLSKKPTASSKKNSPLDSLPPLDELDILGSSDMLNMANKPGYLEEQERKRNKELGLVSGAAIEENLLEDHRGDRSNRSSDSGFTADYGEYSFDAPSTGLAGSGIADPFDMPDEPLPPSYTDLVFPPEDEPKKNESDPFASSARSLSQPEPDPKEEQVSIEEMFGTINPKANNDNDILNDILGDANVSSSPSNPATSEPFPFGDDETDFFNDGDIPGAWQDEGTEEDSDASRSSKPKSQGLVGRTHDDEEDDIPTGGFIDAIPGL